MNAKQQVFKTKLRKISGHKYFINSLLLLQCASTLIWEVIWKMYHWKNVTANFTVCVGCPWACLLWEQWVYHQIKDHQLYFGTKYSLTGVRKELRVLWLCPHQTISFCELQCSDLKEKVAAETMYFCRKTELFSSHLQESIQYVQQPV